MTGRRRKPGRMGPFIEGYRAWLAERGYTPGTIVGMLAVAGGLGRWMDARDIALGDLDRAAVTEFRDALRAAGMRRIPGAHGLDRLLEYLEDQGVLDGPSSSAAPLEVLAERYRRWLVTDRGLAEATVVRYVKLARLFLGQRLAGRGDLENLSGTDIVAFLLAESERLSAAAIEGIAAQLLFRITAFGSGDLEQAIRGADTAVAWWRQQAGEHGLAAVLERSFQNWARDTTTRWAASDVANDQILAAALTANLAGDQGDWRYLSSLLGRDQLLRLDRNSDAATAKAGLSTLRLAGAEESVKLAATRLVQDGPALGAQLAAADIELDSSTSTSARSNLDLLRFAGPVLDEDTANVTVQWILTTLTDPAAFIARTSPTFDVPSRLLDTLGAVLTSASISSHVAVIDYFLALPPIRNQTWASSLSGVVRQLDAAAWTAKKAAHARERTRDDDETLKYPLLGIAAVFYEDVRQTLLADIRSGSTEALHAFGDVRNLSSDVASEVMSSLAAGLRRIISDAHKGNFNVGGPDIGDAATLLNLWHPDQAEWASLLELLADPLVSGDDKIYPIRRLAQQATQIPASQHGALASIAADLVQRPPPGHVRFIGRPQDVAGPAALLQAALGTDSQTFAQLTTTLASAGADRRAWAARLAGQRAQPEDVGLLAALACDTEPEVRASAAAALTRIMADHPGSPLAEATFLHVLQDPGLTVPLTISGTLASVTNSNTAIESARKHLSGHPFQPVRRAIRRNPC